MSEQIRREGGWDGDLHARVMFRVYLVHSTGKYHPGVFVYSRHDAMRFVVEYGLEIPRLFVTHRDEVVLDLEEGILDFPPDAMGLLATYRKLHEPWDSAFADADSVNRWLRESCRELNSLARAHAQASGFDGHAPEDYDDPLNRLQRELLTLAAQENVNLHEYGYRDPGIVVAQLERFDRPEARNDAAPAAVRKGWLTRLLGNR